MTCSNSQMVQQNPALIQPLLQQIAASNPALAQMINQNPAALYELLGAALQGEGGDEDEDMGQQVTQVNLTQDEAAAVERVSRWSLQDSSSGADVAARGSWL